MPLSAGLAVHRSDFVLEAAIDAVDGETLAVLGPNGAGKTTLLEALAGLIPLDRGVVELDGVAIQDRPPERRRVGVAFQDGLLFPRMSVRENVAFPLRMRGASARDARRRAEDLLARLAPAIDPAVRPASLSGGEGQRVALARALATEPRLLLLDEPLASVDVSARADLRALLRREIDRFDGPCILVAHDPLDALTLADRVAILEHGRVVQTGTPEDIRRRPRTSYAADLVGVNLFAGRLEPAADGSGTLRTPDGTVAVAWPEGIGRSVIDDVLATLPPTDISLHLDRPEGSPRNVLRGRVVEISTYGDRARVRVASTPPISAEVTRGSIERLGLAPGVEVFASFKAVEVHLRVERAGTDTLEA